MDALNLNHLKKSPFYSSFIPIYTGVSLSQEWDSKIIQNSISELPILERSHLSANQIGKLLILDDDQDLNPVWSTGTTGTPVCVYRGPDDENRFWQIVLSATPVSGNHEIKVLFLCALKNGKQYKNEIKINRKMVSIERKNIFLSLKKDILDSDPNIITTSTHGLTWLTENSQLLDSSNLTLLYSTALPIGQKLISLLKSKTSVKLLHTYSTTETGPIANYCPDAKCYHVYADIFAESINGCLLISKFYKSSLPLLRYRTGDYGYIQVETCRCGFQGQTIFSLKGRK